MPTVMLIHGWWLHPTTWGAWREFFETAGYETLAPDRGHSLTIDSGRREVATTALEWPQKQGL